MSKSIELTTVVRLYTEEHLTMQEIGDRYGVTRVAIHKRLKAAGVKSTQGTWVDLRCDFCGLQARKRRKQWRKRDRHYCKAECYYAARQNASSVVWRHGTRLARAIVAQHFSLEPQHVVHHKDCNEKNNDISNLLVFASYSDHMKHHHRRNVEPLFDGSSIR